MEHVQEPLIELKGQRKLLQHLPHSVQEQQEHWRAFSLRGGRGVAVSQAERVPPVQPFSLDQICKPVGQGEE